MAAASMDVANCVELTNVVVRVVPPNVTNEAETKFVPLTVSVKAAPPATALSGEIVVIVGRELPPLMVKFTGLEVPPPGVGLVTVTDAVPADLIAAAGTAAVNCVELTNVVVGIVPPKLTIEVVIKLAPLMVRVKPAALPATALVGDIAVIVGTGLPPPPVEAVPPPHPARNPMFTIAEIASPLVSTH
jgi:hypothetical protein